jgi:crotonobetainyl-CoA:carnitine CoA-transferase CaiB-like acyl-CoA transferase
LVEGLRHSGIDLEGVEPHPRALPDEGDCAVLAWARSGAMSLTGWPGQPPQWPQGDVIGRLERSAGLLGRLARGFGAELVVDVGGLLTQRATARGLVRRGTTSVGGRARVVPVADGWLAMSLARESDLDLLPAWSEGAIGRPAGSGPTEPPWDEIEAWARHRPAGPLSASAQLLGMPAAPVGWGTAPGQLPWLIERLGPAAPAPSRSGSRRPVVVDLTALWSGPLCAHLLGRCGAQVIKVEDGGRPDGARWGDPWLFGQLHDGHEGVVLDLARPAGRRALGDLIDSADVVLEASRPRALDALGFGPEPFLAARPGRTWVSITGYGRSGPRSNWVAFGDDAAAAAGLVAWRDRQSPVFCADAIADPITGLYAAIGALASMAGGGGHLVDTSLVASAAFAAGGGSCHGHHRVDGSGSSWTVGHDGVTGVVEPPRPVGGAGYGLRDR